MSKDYTIPDKRCQDPKGYENYDRRGQMKRSWGLGVAQGHNGSQKIAFDEGLTWGSIGQMLGYLLGEVDEDVQDEIYEQMYERFKDTDQGQKLRG